VEHAVRLKFLNHPVAGRAISNVYLFENTYTLFTQPREIPVAANP
jgi:hypothetical protein